ncbi:MAG TPA: hypothetical protein VGL77_18610 [Armatimonadota bacterium]|jgi:hypothetical protein
MSIYVIFTYDNGKDLTECAEDDDSKYVSEQAIVFFAHDIQALHLYGVDQPFVREYRQYLDDTDARYYDWEGSRLFHPSQLSEWATRWLKILGAVSPVERIELLKGIREEEQLKYFIESLKSYLQFAQEAIADGVSIRMSVG